MDKRNPLGPAGQTVRTNVKRLREEQKLSYADLARRLKATGRAIPEVGLRRIEEEDPEQPTRRVDVDDLMALAEALETTPMALLMPTTALSGKPVVTGDELVQTTGRGLERAKILWNHLQGLRIQGLGEITEATLRETADYRRFKNATPPWAVEESLELAKMVNARGND